MVCRKVILGRNQLHDCESDEDENEARKGRIKSVRTDGNVGLIKLVESD